MLTERKESIEILEDILTKKGYIFHELTLGDTRKLYTQICGKDGTPLLTLASDNPLYPFATSSARLITKNKLASHDFVVHNGIAIPQSIVVGQEDSYEAAFNLLKTYKTVIVKPAKESGAHGLTLDITTQDGLQIAVRKALAFGSVAIVQRQFFGEEVRFVIVDGMAVVALLRETPKVIGDGVSTIAELIDEENKKRASLTDTLIVYPMLDATRIPRAFIESGEVLAKGWVCELNKSTMIKGGASIFNIFDRIDESYLKKAERASLGLGRGFVVVDMMVQDIKQPVNEENYVFIEFNLAPALSLFYSCRDGSHFPIVEEYLGPMLEKCMNKSVLHSE
jgi:cyanophycin synthetase